MGDYNASASIFGWHFQINASIYFMLSEIKNVSSIRVEGKNEDIELNLTSGKKIFVQAKSKFDVGIDKKAITKFTDGIRTLISASNSQVYEKLYYVTNYPNPLGGHPNHYYMFMGGTYVEHSFSTLPSEATKKPKEIIKIVEDKYNLTLDESNLNIAVIPFEGEKKDVRERIVQHKIKEFLTDLNLKEGLSNDVLEIWQSDMFFNASQKDTSVNLSKKELMWPVISICCDLNDDDKIIEEAEEDLGLEFEDIELILTKYKYFINRQVERFDFITQILGDFSHHKDTHRRQERKQEYFIEKNWTKYKDELFSEEMDEEILETLIKIILYKILKNKRAINTMIKEVKLNDI